MDVLDPVEMAVADDEDGVDGDDDDVDVAEVDVADAAVQLRQTKPQLFCGNFLNPLHLLWVQCEHVSQKIEFLPTPCPHTLHGYSDVVER